MADDLGAESVSDSPLTAQEAGADEHIFGVYWVNPVELWVAECSCGHSFGHYHTMESAGRAYDRHIDVVRASWGIGRVDA